MTGRRMIQPPSSAHQCELPPANLLPTSTVAICETCGDWSRVVERYVGFGYSSSWSPVRWYHWRLRRRIQRGSAGQQ